MDALVRRDLKALKNYLQNVRGINTTGISIEHDPEHDKVNALDPRAFCYVDPEEPRTIWCSRAIEMLRPEIRIGILLHEIGHIVLDAFDDDESEVEVDSWCRNVVSEAQYDYGPTRYQDWKTSDWIDVDFIERVSPGFVHRVRSEL